MSRTIISSASKEVVIGFDQPFVVIGERINPTGRKRLAAEMKQGDYSRVEQDAIAQIEAGAHILDINAGIPLADEPKILDSRHQRGYTPGGRAENPGGLYSAGAIPERYSVVH